MKQFTRRLIALLSLTLPMASLASPAWVTRSDALARPLLIAESRIWPHASPVSPLSASDMGMEEFDTETGDFAPGVERRAEEMLTMQRTRLEQARARERDIRVKQDIDLMLMHIGLASKQIRLNHQYLVDYIDPVQYAYNALHSLLDLRNTPARQARALTLLARIVGRQPSGKPLIEQIRAHMQADLYRQGLVGPYVKQVQLDLDNTTQYLDGMVEMLKQAHLSGWELDMARLRQQVDQYSEWAHGTLMQYTRPDAPLSRQLYIQQMQINGVTVTPEQLISEASADFQETRDEMQVLAAQIAAQRKLPNADYRAVLAALRQDQIKPDSLLATYQARLQQIEEIIRRESLVSLPARKANIRLASDAESAETPSPFMNTPRLIGNTGEYGEFVIPSVTNNNGAQFDESLTDAESWTLTAHEARPGHELQFASIVEQGVSLARGVFALYSANVEGWAVYSEAMVMPHMPPEAQLASLQNRLLRIARAMLDPMVNLGQIRPEQAREILVDEVCISEQTADVEVQRYTFMMPGQATAYYFGYTRLRGIRTRAEIMLGQSFNLMKFNDFVISQGLLPLDMLQTAVQEDFIPEEQRTRKTTPDTAAMEKRS